jgi:outer membrane receptor protein involved in Fe transport
MPTFGLFSITYPKQMIKSLSHLFPNPKQNSLALIASALLGAGFALHGQDETQNIVELNPFEVSATSVEGYFASEATTGTRIASNIQEMPFAINVVTSEYMDDFQAFDLNEQFAYTTSFVYDGEVAQYYLRGFRASFQLRNGFVRSGLFSKETTNRVEVIKGPLAAIYGRTQPGGVVNYITRKPTENTQQSFRVSLGTYEHKRFAASSSGAIVPGKLRYRFDTSYRYEEIPQGGLRTPFTEDWVVSGVLEYQISQATRVLVEVDRTVRVTGRPSRVPIIYQDLSAADRAAGGKRHLGLAYNLVDRGLNNLPGTEVERRVSAINVLLEHRFNDVWTFRAAGDYADRWFEDLEMYAFVDRFQIRNSLGFENNWLIAREPRLWIQDSEYMSGAADLLADFWTGRIEHKLLFTADYYSWRNLIEDYRLTNNEDPNHNTRNLDVNNPVFNFQAPSRDPNALDPTRPASNPGPYRQHSINTQRLTTGAAFASWRTASLDGRLITLTGIRREMTRYNRFYEVEPAGAILGQASRNIPTYYTYATTMQVGVTYKLTPQHYFFVGYSESYDPNRAIDLEAKPLPDEEGSGIDIGFKSSMRDGRWNMTFTLFSIDRKNVRFEVDQYFPELDRFRTAFDTAGLVKSEGMEIDFNLRMLDHDRLNIFGGYGYNDTEVREAGRDVDLVGRRWQRIPLHMLRVGFRYSFRETALHGLIINGGIRYQSSAVYENGVAEKLTGDPDGVRSGNDGRREIIEPSSTIAEIGGSYSWRGNNNTRHSVQLNIKNLLDFDTPTNGGRVQDPRRIILQYRIDL